MMQLRVSSRFYSEFIHESAFSSEKFPFRVELPFWPITWFCLCVKPNNTDDFPKLSARHKEGLVSTGESTLHYETLSGRHLVVLNPSLSDAPWTDVEAAGGRIIQLIREDSEPGVLVKRIAL